MIHAQRAKHGVFIIPQSVATTATASASMDTLAFEYLSVDVLLDTQAAVSSNPAVLELSEGDTTTGFTTVAAFVGDGGSGFTIPDADTSDAQMIVLNLDLKKRKRYIKIAIKPAGTAQLLAASYHLTRANEMPDTAAEAGCAALVNG